MAITQIPSKDSSPPTALSTRADGSDLYAASDWESAYRRFEADDVPHLLIQLQDDLARSRRREAIWLSVILHLFLVILIVNEPRLERFLPRRAVVVATPINLQEKELTFLEMPPDEQKLTPKPKDTNIISDKNRIATSRTPHLDRDELKRILDSSRPGAPGSNNAGTQPQPNQPPTDAQSASQQQQAQQQPSPAPSAPNQNQMAKLQAPPVAKQPKVNFGASMSAGSAIEQAARAALENRGAGYGGDGGDFGLGQGQRGQVMGPMEVLSDTMGVDFGPYLSRVLQNVKTNWYLLIPEVARPPLMKKGKVALEFAILKDGKVAGLQVRQGSGDVALDRAAYGSITNSNPFPPLPTQFGGPYLALRFYYYYNPESNELN